VTYLVVGLDRRTLAPWHQNVRADDAVTASDIAADRAQARGIELVVAAVIGPSTSVAYVPVDRDAGSAQAA
jgi:hypothetical protein